jgi:hypothetical protein
MLNSLLVSSSLTLHANLFEPLVSCSSAHFLLAVSQRLSGFSSRESAIVEVPEQVPRGHGGSLVLVR